MHLNPESKSCLHFIHIIMNSLVRSAKKLSGSGPRAFLGFRVWDFRVGNAKDCCSTAFGDTEIGDDEGHHDQSFCIFQPLNINRNDKGLGF
jgi:hypothetical protein